MKPVKYVKLDQVKELLKAIDSRNKYYTDSASYENEDKIVMDKITKLVREAIVINETNEPEAEAEIID